MIKIDAEGAEVDVLRGGVALLREHRPTLIVEFSDEARLVEAEVLLPDYAFELLSDLHYVLRPRR